MHAPTKMMEDRKLIIDEIISFSTYDMFRFIFPITKLIKAKIERIESYSKLILKKQLQCDFLAEEIEPMTHQISLFQTNLEQGLSSVFGRNMSFWEKYYARRSKMENYMHVDSAGLGAASNNIRKLTRIKYYHHYIPLDTLYYHVQVRSHSYELIQQSMQWKLESQIFNLLGQHKQSQATLVKALNIIGPLDVELYRHHLVGLNII